jgi:methylthioribulose-1-phosphate dehydratase
MRLQDIATQSMEFRQRTAQLCAVGRTLYARGMVPATSGNFSSRLSSGHILITVSGAHKGRLDPSHLMLIDLDGQAPNGGRASAETALHLQIYRRYPEVNAVLHPHSVAATLLSRRTSADCVLANYELLKAFPGITTHDTSITIPNFPNDQDVERLARHVDQWMEQHPPVVGYLISGHGFYTWGNSINAALRHVEALEFLFECELRTHGAPPP